MASACHLLISSLLLFMKSQFLQPDMQQPMLDVKKRNSGYRVMCSSWCMLYLFLILVYIWIQSCNQGIIVWIISQRTTTGTMCATSWTLIVPAWKVSKQLYKKKVHMSQVNTLGTIIPKRNLISRLEHKKRPDNDMLVFK